jgi:hypothetical protein
MINGQRRLATPIQEGKISSLVLPFPLRTPRSLEEAYEARRQA